MASATSNVERIVRKVMKEEQDETISAIQELSALLTEQVIPKLSHRSNGSSNWQEDEDDSDSDDFEASAMSASDDGPGSRPGKPSPGDDDDAGSDEDLPEHEIPRAVLDAFATLYHTLSPDQTSALAELFTVVDSEIDDEGKESDEPNEEEGEEAQLRG